MISDSGYYINIYDKIGAEVGHLSIHNSKTQVALIRAGHFKFNNGNEDISLLNRLYYNIKHYEDKAPDNVINITLFDERNEVKFIYMLNGKLSSYIKNPNELKLLEVILDTLNKFIDKLLFDEFRNKNKYLKYKNKYLKLKKILAESLIV